MIPCSRALPDDLRFDDKCVILFDDEKCDFICYSTRNWDLDDLNAKRKLMEDAGIYRY